MISTFISPSIPFLSRQNKLSIKSHRKPRTFYLCQNTQTTKHNLTIKSPIKATLFSSGKRLYLEQSTTSIDLDFSTETKYLLCPTCYSAYVANALKTSQSVRCPKCTHVFQASPSLLYNAIASKINNQTITKPSIHSTKIICDHIQKCPGCTVPTQIFNPPSLYSIINILKHLGASPPPIDSSKIETHYWRTHAKLAARTTQKNIPTLGLFQSKSHTLLPIPQCSVHAPEINTAVNLLQKVLRNASYSIYNEFKNEGLVRYVLFTVHRQTRLVQLTLVLNATNWKNASPMAPKLCQELWKQSGGKLFHSIWFNWNSSLGNAIVNPERVRWYHAQGEKDLAEKVLGVDIYFTPYAFRQANLDAFEKQLLPTLLQYIPFNSSVAEFCAGVGIIGLVALQKRKLKALRASELHDGGKEAFWKSIRKASLSDTDVSYLVGSDSETIDMIDRHTDVVIVDPPRGGLSSDFVEKLAQPDKQLHLSRLIYVSCGFQAFKRDANILINGDWKLTASHVFILFPGSDHVETLAIFDRKGRRGSKSTMTNKKRFTRS